MNTYVWVRFELRDEDAMTPQLRELAVEVFSPVLETLVTAAKMKDAEGVFVELPGLPHPDYSTTETGRLASYLGRHLRRERHGQLTTLVLAARFTCSSSLLHEVLSDGDTRRAVTELVPSDTLPYGSRVDVGVTTDEELAQDERADYAAFCRAYEARTVVFP